MAIQHPQVSSLDDIIDEVKRICKEENLDPWDINGTKFFKYTTKPITQNRIKTFGGLTGIIKDYFGPRPGRDLAIIHGSKRKSSYVSSLEKFAGDRSYFYDHVLKQVCNDLKEFKFPVPKSTEKPKITANEREIVALISDTHFGLTIDDKELGGINKYSWTIAARRMALFATQIATFKEESRSQTPVLRLCLGGDLAQGIIHLSDSNTDLLTHQIIGTTHILYQMISYLRKFFKCIKVECTADNHMRMVHKGSKDRSMAQKYDSYATIIHSALKMGFLHCKDVEFNIPKTPYTAFNVLGNNFYLTHGDTLINVGMPGKSINTSQITDAANKLNASLKDHNEYRVILCGHVHTPCFITLNNGTELVVNGTGSGVDPYAHSIGIFESHPAQVIFESTKDFPVGDQRKVFLKDADDNPKYDKIIKPYNYDIDADYSLIFNK